MTSYGAKTFEWDAHRIEWGTMPSCTSFPPLFLSIIGFGLPPQTNPLCSVCLQIASNLVPTRSKGALSIELESFHALHRGARQSSSQMASHSNSSSFNWGSCQPPKCVMVGPHPNLGYSRGEDTFGSVEAMQTKKWWQKEENNAGQTRKDTVNIDIVHKKA